MSVENLRFVAVVVLVAIGSAVAQQQPQEPKLHGFKARLCAMTTVPHSPAWDNCMAAGFGKPHPSQPPQPAAAPRQVASAPQQVASAPQQVASAPQQVASAAQQVSPQLKLQEPIMNGTPAQAPVQTPVQEKTCMEYMTTSSGAQTCLRFENDQER